MAIKNEYTSHTLRFTVENSTDVFDLPEAVVRELCTGDINIVVGNTEGRLTLSINGLEVPQKDLVKVEDVKKEEEVMVKMEGKHELVKNEILEDVPDEVKLDQEGMGWVGVNDGNSDEGGELTAI